MDDYENIFNGAGSAPTAAGGAASLGPDAAGYAPTAAATPPQGSAGTSASPVDALAPLAKQQAATALSLGASALSPANGAQTAAATGVFTQGGAQPATDLLAQLKQNALQGVLDRRGLGQAQNGGASNDSIKSLVEGMLNARGGNAVPVEEVGGQQTAPAPAASSAQPAPEPPIPQFTPARGAFGGERMGYDYNGVRVELPAGFDTSDPVKTAAQVRFSNEMVDWMNNDDDEMEV